jgi:hypothetical protein
VFLETPVQISDMRDAINDNFAINNNFEPQYTMRGRMLRTHVNNHFFRANCFTR